MGKTYELPTYRQKLEPPPFTAQSLDAAKAANARERERVTEQTGLLVTEDGKLKDYSV